ncbi:MAG: 50S ribosomal protein L17 [Nitrospirae bacterium CG_4_9_14_3_um_filter_53_35]|nr:MAG: 50S ribosomal protein L17 [Nitrospirae bacterium CG2_30_53_67]PIV85408.1 MAG: 50S ribosomal protein L17 [Nitrospirae bacterium CG17_big_fil_post_rev_8_21_14_2_50_50_9]PIW86003.1 MAG: 50S ribosomal protein L17 [Nitrospirae bacterium CG_4_8_14_3_um_filter_50_41]PIX86893.1 MAG: 50S ribosomal protein L17 [Nitrospirae bacterium CG_4_10_14_3_um_filter_53_41]PJA76356.1 MAG: 50S ribosomal protein L17 [Nitrospirae bacterium CG_4_9_14_3_um_filter_53_35]
MRHNIAGRALSRTSSHRAALMKNLAGSLIRYEAIETTLPKAKELRPFAEKLITVGKKGTLAARRRAFDLLRDLDLVKKLFDSLAPRFKERNGGYTRILRTRTRPGDGAVMAVIEYLDRELKAPKKTEPEKPEKKKSLLKKVMEKGKSRKPKAESPEAGKDKKKPEKSKKS